MSFMMQRERTWRRINDFMWMLWDLDVIDKDYDSVGELIEDVADKYEDVTYG